MTRSIWLAFIAAVCMAIGAAAPVMAHPGHDHKILGTVTMGNAEKPLIGVQAPAASYEDASCPFFPDSILR